MKTLRDQISILSKHFPSVDFKKVKGEGYVLFKWQLIAPTYPEALQKIFDAIISTRTFYNWRRVDMARFKETDIKVSDFRTLPDVMVLDAQLGTKYKGRSVEDVRQTIRMDSTEIGLGAFEVAIILLTHPDILKSYDDLWIDCPGDDCSVGSGVSRAPIFSFSADRLEFYAHKVGDAGDSYGSASGFLPQTFAPRSLGTRVQKLEDIISKMRKAMEV